MKGERQSQTAKMLLLVTAIAAFIASASAANQESHIQRYLVNGQAVSQSVMEQAQAAAMSALGGQPTADDRSLLLHKTVAKGLALKKLKKKKKKNPFKSPLKSLPLLPLLGIGGVAATAAAAANTATKAAVGATPALFSSPSTYISTIPENADLPIWKVHKYNGIDIRPVRLSDLPLPPPSESDYKQVVGNAPKEVLVPEPAVPTPVDTYPTPADTVTFPETPKDVYGPPSQMYGPPSLTYGPPAPIYGVPYPPYSVPTQSYILPSQQDYQASSATDGLIQMGDDAATAEGIEAISTLGALTDLLPGGGDSSSGLPGLFGGQNRGIAPLSFFNRFIRGPQLAAQIAETPTTSTTFRQPSQSAIQNLLGRIPIISSLTSFGNQNPSTHVNIPPLPELPALPEISNVRGPSYLPQIPHIRLPTKYVVRGSPYVSIRTPQQPQTAPIVDIVNPIPTDAPVPEPALEPVKPEASYQLPLEQPQPQYSVLNSYGQSIQHGYYVTPAVFTGPPPPQFGQVQYYPNQVVGKPAAAYGLPGGDSSVAASEIDPATVTGCSDSKSCTQDGLRVAVPEGETRAVARSQSAVAPSPVFKKKGTVEIKETSVENISRYLDPKHPSATKTQSASPVVDDVDAKPSTATEEEDS